MKRERGKEDSISFKEEQKNGRNVENYVKGGMSPAKKTEIKILERDASRVESEVCVCILLHRDNIHNCEHRTIICADK